MNPPFHSCRSTHLDDISDISPLQCGSIVPDPEYNPSRVPVNDLACVPPLDIFIGEKAEIPEWLQLDNSDAPNNHIYNRLSSATSDENDFDSELREPPVLWDLQHVEESRDVSEGSELPLMELHAMHCANHKPCKESFRCAISTTSDGTLHTSPTDLSCQENESLRLAVVSERAPIGTKRFVGRFPLFRKRRRHVSLRRSRGLLV
jgi:hypothetical protein